MKRRNFVQGLALGAGVGTLGAMGAYSYSPARTAFLPDIKRGTADIGLCKSVKITNISETSWFDNSIFMQDVTASGGLLVDFKMHQLVNNIAFVLVLVDNGHVFLDKP